MASTIIARKEALKNQVCDAGAVIHYTTYSHVKNVNMSIFENITRRINYRLRLQQNGYQNEKIFQRPAHLHILSAHCRCSAHVWPWTTNSRKDASFKVWKISFDYMGFHNIKSIVMFKLDLEKYANEFKHPCITNQHKNISIYSQFH